MRKHVQWLSLESDCRQLESNTTRCLTGSQCNFCKISDAITKKVGRRCTPKCFAHVEVDQSS